MQPKKVGGPCYDLNIYFTIYFTIVWLNINLFISCTTILFKKVIVSNKTSQYDGITKRKKADELRFGLFQYNSNCFVWLQEIEIFS